MSQCNHLACKNATCRGDTLEVGLWYPREEQIKFISIDLVEVRHAPDIRVSYDFKRNGWVIERKSEEDTWVEQALISDSGS